jgi:hypothetical protein
MSVLHRESRPYVLYLDRTQAIWGGDDLKNLITIPLATGTIVDLEIPSQKVFENQLITWIDQFSIKPRETVIILAPELMFTQDFGVKADAEIQAFLDKIPFDDPTVKRVTTPTAEKVSVISSDLIQPLLQLFKNHQFTILAVFPASVLKQTNPPVPITNEMLSAIMTQLPLLEPQAIYTPAKTQESMTSIRNSEGKIFSPRLILMIALFTGLIVLLVVVLISNGYFSPAPAPVAPAPEPIEIEIVPTSTPVVEETTPELASESAIEATPEAQPTLDTVNESAVQ